MKQVEKKLVLSDSVRFLPGVGERRAEAFTRVGVRTLEDLLNYLPARHERQEARTIENLDLGMTATIVGRIVAIRQQGGRRNARISATLTDNTGRCSLCWFNAPWVSDQLEQGSIIRATGKVGEFGQLPQIVNPTYVVLDDDAQPVNEKAPPRFEPVYPATAELPSRVLARLIGKNLEILLPLVREYHSAEFLRQRGLMLRQAALRAMHRPQSDQQLTAARRRLAFDELLLMQMAVQTSRRSRAAQSATPLSCTPEIDVRIRRRFPFALTPGQNHAIRAIAADIGVARAMHRLLQGDVGCGKTVVALYAALVAVASRTQVAILAPTELLAEQHFRALEAYLRGSRVRYSLFMGGMPAKPRRELLAALAAGQMDIVVGTHAILQDDVEFNHLGLVVVDEQHRFGVRQRATLKSKGPSPHYLVMTATPIPRTLALTVFGDLDVTTIDDLPPGRTPISTRVAGPADHDGVWEFVRSRVVAGEQAYIVYPLIDPSDRVSSKAAAGEFDRLSENVFRGYQCGLLHGRLDSEKRGAIMSDFISGRVKVLVATTVIEVGIDVPNATCMVVEHAERYGLSQLHQLRGRVGRGRSRSYCLLMTDSRGAEEQERLTIMISTNDGFKIAEEDLRIRGPGEMLGYRQHGLPELRVADLVGDQELLRMAQQDAGDLLRSDPDMKSPDHAVIRSILIEKYHDVIGLSNVG
jgi:ATP-dependent DNA helicase RecG